MVGMVKKGFQGGMALMGALGEMVKEDLHCGMAETEKRGEMEGMDVQVSEDLQVVLVVKEVFKVWLETKELKASEEPQEKVS